MAQIKDWRLVFFFFYHTAVLLVWSGVEFWGVFCGLVLTSLRLHDAVHCNEFGANLQLRPCFAFRGRIGRSTTRRLEVSGSLCNLTNTKEFKGEDQQRCECVCGCFFLRADTDTDY